VLRSTLALLPEAATGGEAGGGVANMPVRTTATAQAAAGDGEWMKSAIGGGEVEVVGREGEELFMHLTFPILISPFVAGVVDVEVLMSKLKEWLLRSLGQREDSKVAAQVRREGWGQGG